MSMILDGDQIVEFLDKNLEDSNCLLILNIVFEK